MSNGKGDLRRGNKTNDEKYRANYDAIFRAKSRLRNRKAKRIK